MVTLGWFVCPSVSIVTTSRTTGLEKTIYNTEWTDRSRRWNDIHVLGLELYARMPARKVFWATFKSRQ